MLVCASCSDPATQALRLLDKEGFTTLNSVLVMGFTNRFCSRHHAAGHVLGMSAG